MGVWVRVGLGVCGRGGGWAAPAGASSNAIIVSSLSDDQIRGSIVVSISACHAEDPGSIPGRGILLSEQL